MATGKSGSLTWTSGYFTVQVNWSETYEVSSNTSNVTISSIQVKSSNWYGWDYYPDGTITINGTTVKTLNSALPDATVVVNAKNTFYTIKSGSSTTSCSLSNIAHNTDGSKSINIELNLRFYTPSGGGGSGWKVSGAQSIALTTIPRASTITSASNVTLGSRCGITWTPASTSFKYKIGFSLGSWSYTTGFISPGTTSAYTYSGYSIPIAAMPNSTSGTMTAILTTYDSSGNPIGSASSKTFTVTYSGSSPSIGTITLDPVDINGYNYLVQGKNKLSISVSGSTASSGSSIQSYTFSGPGISTTTTSTSVTSANNIADTGSLTYTVKVTDSRGLTASKTASITCYEYKQPSFTSFDSYRVASSTSTTADDKGTYLRCAYNIEYSSVNNTNSVSVTVFYKKKSASTWSSKSGSIGTTSVSGSKKIVSGSTVLSSIEAGSTYLVYIQVTDNYGGSVQSGQNTTFGESRILNIRTNGNGIAFGKMAETDNLFESKWPAKFDSNCEVAGNLTIGTSTQSATPTTGIHVHDVRSASVTPDSFGNNNANFYFSTAGWGTWQSILHMKGWSGDYAAWELAGNAHNASIDDSLKYRQGIGNTWGDWQTVITNKNINNYVDMSAYLPLSAGVALSGRLGLQGNAYYTSGSYGLNCNNSDIINANGIYFGDASDSAGEAICFYRSDGYWDTLYAVNGALKFHPNRSTSAGLGGYNVYHNGNFKIETGTVTLNSSTETSRTFASTTGFAGTPNVLLTPVTSTIGIITAKIRSVNSAGFTAIIGGSVSGSIPFAYIAIYGSAV